MPVDTNTQVDSKDKLASGPNARIATIQDTLNDSQISKPESVTNENKSMPSQVESKDKVGSGPKIATIREKLGRADGSSPEASSSSVDLQDPAKKEDQQSTIGYLFSALKNTIGYGGTQTEIQDSTRTSSESSLADDRSRRDD